MARSLSGTVGESLSFVVSRFGGLVTVSLAPFLLLAGCMIVYAFVIEGRIASLETADIEELGQNTAGDMLLSLVSLVVFMWLSAKVHRFYLAEETPSLIGSGGTIKSALVLCVYYIGAAIIVYLPMAVAAVLLGLALFTVSEWLPIIGVTIIIAVAMWVFLRLLVGHVPASLGEWPGFFSGWSLTRGQQIPLLLGILALLLIVVSVTLAVVGILVGIGYLFFEAIAASIDITGLAVIGGVLYAVLSIVLTWPMIVYFAAVYERLSGRDRPLPTS